jgi:hypothetical protein
VAQSIREGSIAQQMDQARNDATGLRRILAHSDLTALVLVLLLGAVGLAYFWTPTDYDFWWHLRNGQVVLESGIPTADTLSATAAGTRWIMHEWLTEAAMYALYQGAGYGLLVALLAAISIATYALLYRVLRAAGAGPALAVALLAVRIVLEAPAWGVRPQIITPFLFTVFVAVLWGYRHRTTASLPGGAGTGWQAWIGPDRRLWLLVPLTWLWANLHGSFIVGPMLLGVWLVGEALNGALGWRQAPPLRPLLAVSVAGGLVSLLNPNGLDLWLYPLTYAAGGGATNLLLYIQEWQPPDPRKLQTLPFLLTLLSLIAVALLRPRASDPPVAPAPDPPATAWGRRWAEHLLRGPVPVTGDAVLLLGMGLFLLMALQTMRLLSQWGTIWALGMAVLLPRLWTALGRDRQGRTAPARGLFHLALAGGTLALLAGVLLTAPRAQLGPVASLDRFPAEAVAYLNAHPDLQTDHFYNTWEWGGYLLFAHRPDQRVFIDGRGDIYQGTVLNDYVASLSGGPDWPLAVQKYGLQGALVPRGSALARTIAGSGWTQLCCDSGPALLFQRSP